MGSEIQKWRAAKAEAARAAVAAEAARPSAFKRGAFSVSFEDGAALFVGRDARLAVPEDVVPHLAAHLLKVWGGIVPAEVLDQKPAALHRFIQNTRPVILAFRDALDETSVETKKSLDAWLEDCATLIGPVPEPEPAPSAEEPTPVSIPHTSCEPAAVVPAEAAAS